MDQPGTFHARGLLTSKETDTACRLHGEAEPQSRGDEGALSPKETPRHTWASAVTGGEESAWLGSGTTEVQGSPSAPKPKSRAVDGGSRTRDRVNGARLLSQAAARPRPDTEVPSPLGASGAWGPAPESTPEPPRASENRVVGLPEGSGEGRAASAHEDPASGRVQAFLETVLHDAVQASEGESHPDTPTHTVCMRAYAHVYLPIYTHACTRTHTLQLTHTEAQLINGRTVARRASWNPLNNALSRGSNGSSLS